MATQKMLKFVTLDRATPEKRGAEARKEDFGEIYRQYAAEQDEAQASRC